MDIAQQNFNDWILGLLEKDSGTQLTSEEVGIALGYDDPRKSVLKIYEKNKEELGEYTDVVYVTARDEKSYLARVYNSQGVAVIAMLSGRPKARKFRAWLIGELKERRSSNKQ